MQIKLLYPSVYKAAASVACLVFPSAGVILHFSLLSYAEKKKFHTDTTSLSSRHFLLTFTAFRKILSENRQAMSY